MNFKRNFLALIYSLIAFNTVVCSNAADIKTMTLSDSDMEYSNKHKGFIPKRNYCQQALSLSGSGSHIEAENLNHDKAGSFGTVCFTTDGKYGIKRAVDDSVSQYTSEILNLNKVTTLIKNDKPAGFNVCTPIVLFNIKNTSGQLRNSNIQIYPKIASVKNMKDVVINSIDNQNAVDLKTIQSLGTKLGEFQSKNISKQYNNFDKGNQHGDFNSNNILVTACQTNGEGTFALIDISEYRKDGRLISDPVYFIYFASAVGNENGISYNTGMKKLIENFYFGYVKALPQDVSKKLKDTIFNAPDLYTGGPLVSARGVGIYKYEFHNINKLKTFEPMQQQAFNEAYNAHFPNIQHPMPVFVPQPVANVPASFFLTDGNWVNGIARGCAGFFVPNQQPFTNNYKIGNFVKFLDGQNCEITKLVPNGGYLNVYVTGNPLDPNKVGLPTQFLVTNTVDRSFFLTDGNWDYGISKHWAGFFVPNTPTFTNKYKIGKYVFFDDHSYRKISGIKENGSYLNINVEGEKLKWFFVGFPSNFHVS